MEIKHSYTLLAPLDSVVLKTIKGYGSQELGLVYKITCVINQRSYVGQTSGCWFQFFPHVRRFKEHRNELTRGLHGSRLLQQDWNLFGESNFLVEILEVVPLERFKQDAHPPRYKSLLLKQEEYWQAKLNAVYSKSLVALIKRV